MPIVLTNRTALIVAIAMAAGCGDRSSPAPSDPAAIQTPPTSGATIALVDTWLGEWTGPEGTSLTLSKSEVGYRVIIRSLDGPTEYEGKPVEDHIEFERNGKTESILATDGKGTGMKWLQEKKNCLIIQLGEGFCRD